MQRFFLAALLSASLVTVFAIPQAAHASGPAKPVASTHSQATLQPETHKTIYPNRYPWGQCTWWAAQTRLDENLENLGNAQMWPYYAAKHGLRVGYVPKVGATVVFGPGIQGAGPVGHVAHVLMVEGARFEISEMNFYGRWPHGGFGKVDYRWAYIGTSVVFIY